MPAGYYRNDRRQLRRGFRQSIVNRFAIGFGTLVVRSGLGAATNGDSASSALDQVEESPGSSAESNILPAESRINVAYCVADP